QCEGREYYATRDPRIRANASIYFPDARTLVLAGEEQIRTMIKQPAALAPTPALTTSDDWKNVSQGLYALVINNEHHRWKIDSMSEDPDDIPVAKLIESSRRVVLGVALSETLRLKAIATYPTELAAGDCAKKLTD